jgi:hypothetical protein
LRRLAQPAGRKSVRNEEPQHGRNPG